MTAIWCSSARITAAAAKAPPHTTAAQTQRATRRLDSSDDRGTERTEPGGSSGGAAGPMPMSEDSPSAPRSSAPAAPTPRRLRVTQSNPSAASAARRKPRMERILPMKLPANSWEVRARQLANVAGFPIPGTRSPRLRRRNSRASRAERARPTFRCRPERGSHQMASTMCGGAWTKAVTSSDGVDSPRRRVSGRRTGRSQFGATRADEAGGRAARPRRRQSDRRGLLFRRSGRTEAIAPLSP